MAVSSPLLAVWNQGENYRDDMPVASCSQISDERGTSNRLDQGAGASLVRKKGMMEGTRHNRMMSVLLHWDLYRLLACILHYQGKKKPRKAFPALAKMSQKSIDVLLMPSFPVQQKLRGKAALKMIP